MAHSSSKAVITALVANAILTVLKFAAAVVTHSASMMNEAKGSYKFDQPVPPLSAFSASTMRRSGR